MELPEVRNPNSVRDLLADLGHIYTNNVKLSRDIIYSSVLREKCIENEDKVHWREDFANYCYNLRYRGFYDDTNILEDAVTELEDEDECDKLMKCLTLLAGSVKHPTQQQSGLIPITQQPHHVLPSRHNRYYGDTRAQGHFGGGLLLYRDELFENVNSCLDIKENIKQLEGFPTSTPLSRFIRPTIARLPPPTVTMSGEPALPLQLPSPCQIFPPFTPKMEVTGFITPILADLPALPAPLTTSIFKTLSRQKEVPQITSGPVLRTGVKQRFAAAQPQVLQRSAPVRPSLSLSAVSDSSGIESDNELWEQAFQDMDKEFPTPTYELVGRKVLQERPYLSESGCETYTRLCVLLCSPYADLDIVTEKHVLYQCQYVLLGIPTSIFQFDKMKVEFVPLQNICYTGVSPDSLVDSLYSIAYSGTLYLRLKMFCDQYSAVERYGNVVKALVSAVEQYLIMYQAFLNQIPVASLIELIWKTKELTAQLEFLCNLLLLEEGLPVGTALLDYLHDTAEMLAFSPYSKLVLTMVRAALTPYVKFLELWLCEGRVWDEWNEFHISDHPEWLSSKDYLYWQFGYTEREGVKLPKFLAELSEQLVNTGKLINLLRLCVPDHPLSVSKFRPPVLKITFDGDSIAQNMRKWQTYKDSIEIELKTQAAVRDMKLREEEEERVKTLVEAKEDSKRRISLIMEEAGELRARARNNKRQELERLQEQMLDKAEERAAMFELERKEDSERIERNQTQQYELVARVRSQLEEYYTTLTQEKAREERRSLWRIQRMKLNRLRRAHIMLEMNSLNREMRDNIDKIKVRSAQQQSGSKDSITVKPHENVSQATDDDLADDNLADDVTTTRKTWELPIDIKINVKMVDNNQVDDEDMGQSEPLNIRDLKQEPSNNGTDEEIRCDKVSREFTSDNPDSTTSTYTVTAPEKVTLQSPVKIKFDVVQRETEPVEGTPAIISSDNDVLKIAPKEVISGAKVSDDVALKDTALEVTEEEVASIGLSGKETTSAEVVLVEVFPDVSSVKIAPEDIDIDMNSDDDSEISFTLSPANDNEPKIQTEKTESHPSQQKTDKSETIPDLSELTIKVKKYEPDGQMKELLYNLPSPLTDKQSPTTTIPTMEGSEMKTLLYSTDCLNKPHIELSFEPQSQVKDLLYPGNNDTDQLEPEGHENGETHSDKPFEPPGQMKDLLYSDNTDSKPHTVLYNEPKGRMKEMLYGTPGSTTTSEAETWSETTPAYDVNTDKKLKDDSTSDLEASVDDRVQSFGLSDDSGIYSVEEQVESMKVAFPEVNARPNPNIMTERLTRHYVAEKTTEEIDVEKHISLEVTLKRLILQPLLLQTNMVNAAAVLYFFDELKINQHFDALRSYLCMNDGMFGDTLSKSLFKMIDSGTDITSSPAKLNSALQEAMECSKINNRLSLECVGNQVSEDVLDCLVLRYDTDWPSNIIINDNTLFKYNEIFKFLLKLKHGCYMLDKIWFLLGSVDKRGGSPQMRRLQACRHEVAQFLHAVQIYMTHQLHNISWHEFQADLKTVDSVSLLQEVHTSYVNNAMERLFLGESTKAPYQIILKIFKHVTVFLRLLERGPFTEDMQGFATHPHFDKLIQRHEDFKKQAIFVLKIAESSNSSGYKPYIDEFTLRLDFNDYYRSSTILKRQSAIGLNRLGCKSLVNFHGSPANALVSKSLVNSLSSPANTLVSKSLNL